MKKIILLTALFFTLLLLSSCLTTLHPIFTEKDLVFDPRLVGKWSNIEDASTATYRPAHANELNSMSAALRRNGSRIYMLEERDAQGRLKSKQYAFMVKLGKYYYMDFYPARLQDNGMQDEFFATHFVPMHSIYRIRFKNSQSFDIQQLDAKYLESLIRNKKIRIKHEITEDGSYVITAPTGELQKYIVKYSDIPEAYNGDNSSGYNKIN